MLRLAVFYLAELIKFVALLMQRTQEKLNFNAGFNEKEYDESNFKKK